MTTRHTSDHCPTCGRRYTTSAANATVADTKREARRLHAEHVDAGEIAYRLNGGGWPSWTAWQLSREDVLHYLHQQRDGTSTDVLQLSTRARNILGIAGILTVEELERWPHEAILELRNCGPVVFTELYDAVDRWREKAAAPL